MFELQNANEIILFNYNIAKKLKKKPLISDDIRYTNELYSKKENNLIKNYTFNNISEDNDDELTRYQKMKKRETAKSLSKIQRKKIDLLLDNLYDKNINNIRKYDYSKTKNDFFPNYLNTNKPKLLSNQKIKTKNKDSLLKSLPILYKQKITNDIIEKVDKFFPNINDNRCANPHFKKKETIDYSKIYCIKYIKRKNEVIGNKKKNKCNIPALTIINFSNKKKNQNKFES